MDRIKCASELRVSFFAIGVLGCAEIRHHMLHLRRNFVMGIDGNLGHGFRRFVFRIDLLLRSNLPIEREIVGGGELSFFELYKRNSYIILLTVPD